MKGKLIRNTLASGGATLLTGLAGFLILPFLVSRLGLLEVGLLGLVNVFAIGGYIALFEGGMQSAIVKFTAEHLARGERERVNALVNTTIPVFFGIGAMLAAVGTVTSPLIAGGLFRVPVEMQPAFRTALIVMFASYLYQFPGLALASVLEGFYRFELVRGVQAAVALCYAGLTVVLVLLGFRFFELVVLLVGLQLCQFLIYAAALFRTPGLSLNLRNFSRREGAEVLDMTKILFIGRTFSVIYHNTDRVLVGSMLGGVAVGIYDVIVRAPRFLKGLLGFVNSAVLPAASELFARDQQKTLARLFLTGTQFQATLSYPIATGLMVYAGSLLAIWMGSEFRQYAIMLQLAMSYNLVVSLIGIGGSLVVGTNTRLVRHTWIGVLSTLINVGLTVILLQWLGLIGVFIGTISSALITLPLHFQNFRAVAGVGYRTMMSRFARLVAAVSVPAIGSVGLRQLVGSDHGAGLLLHLSVWCALYWVALYFFAFGSDERHVLIALYRAVRNRLAFAT